MTVIYNAHGSPRVNSGDTVVIRTNGAVSGGVGPYTLSAQWHRDGAPIKDATANQYKVTDDDVGHVLTCIQICEDRKGRRLKLKPSNQLMVGKAKRGARPDLSCPPGTTPHGPRASRIVPAVSRENPLPKPTRPSKQQLQAEVRKVRGGCRSCGGAKGRSRRNNP